MTTYIALLRAVNLAGHNRVSMGALRELLTDLGLRNAQTVLQSGNAVFEGDHGGSARLERTLEAALAQQLGVRTDFFVRTATDWQAMIDQNPFPREAKRDPGHLLLYCLKARPGPHAVTALRDAITGREVVRAGRQCAYAVYPDGVGRSRLTSALLERTLGTRGTGRNWNTVVRLGQLAGVR